jgi:hypothetical protein
MQYVNAMLRQHVGPICSSPKERLAKYIRHTYSQMQITLIPVVSSSWMTYANVVSVPAEEQNIHIWHTSLLIPQVVPMRLTLCWQRCIRQKNIFTSCGSGHKTFPGLYSPHDGLQSLSHDRGCPQATPSWGDGFRIHITRREEAYLLTLA